MGSQSLHKRWGAAQVASQSCSSRRDEYNKLDTGNEICPSRFAGFKEAERERLANHFNSNFKLDMLDREHAVKV